MARPWARGRSLHLPPADSRGRALADARTADVRADARSRSPKPLCLAAGPSAGSSTDNHADLVADVRAFIQLGRRQATALNVAVDRLEDAVTRIDRDRD